MKRLKSHHPKPIILIRINVEGNNLFLLLLRV